MVKKNESPAPRAAEKKPDSRPPRRNGPRNPIMSFLNELLNRPIEVRTKKGDIITGILRGYDNHVNLIIEKQTAPDSSIKFLIRGDSIEYVRPR